MKQTLQVAKAAAVAAALGLACAPSGAAQAQANPPPGADGRAGHERHWGDPAAMKQRIEARRHEREQLLHDALGLRGDQEDAWRSFVAALAPAAGSEDRGPRMDREEGAHLTLPERLDRMSQRLAARQSAFQQRAQALKSFYAVLDSRQQKTFEALMRLRRQERGHGDFGGRPGPDRQG